MNSKNSVPYRYELWRLEEDTLVHCRVTDKRLDPNDPEIIDGRTYLGYPRGYQWRVYRGQRELGRVEPVEPGC